MFNLKYMAGYKINPRDRCFKCEYVIIQKKLFFFASRGCFLKNFNPLSLNILVCEDFKKVPRDQQLMAFVDKNIYTFKWPIK